MKPDDQILPPMAPVGGGKSHSLRHLHAQMNGNRPPPEWSSLAPCACPKGCAVRVEKAGAMCERCQEECQ